MADRVLKPRRTRRVQLGGSLCAEVNGGYEAVVLDLSEQGARIEHREIVHPGQVYVLQLGLPGRPAPLCLPAQVIWSWVHHFEAEREQPLVYQSGLEFQPLPAEVRQPLEAFLAASEGAEPERSQAAAELSAR